MATEQNILTFPAGLPGLPRELTKFSLSSPGERTPFFLLNSVEDENTGFILINPFALFPDYEFELPDEELKTLGIGSPEQVAVFCIVNASRGLKNATVNLLAPVVVNPSNGLARQVVLVDKRYNVRQPLPVPMATAAGEG